MPLYDKLALKNKEDFQSELRTATGEQSLVLRKFSTEQQIISTPEGISLSSAQLTAIDLLQPFKTKQFSGTIIDDDGNNASG